MPSARYDDKRDANEAEIVTALEGAGATVVRLKWVDLLVGFRGAAYLLEVKTARGRLNAKQREQFARWRGAPVVVVRTPEQALEAIGAKWEG